MIITNRRKNKKGLDYLSGRKDYDEQTKMGFILSKGRMLLIVI